MATINRRYDFVLLFDVRDGNPNGDPDAGNLPRMDPETGHGLVTDVCLKRKIRNYIGLVKEDRPGYAIYVREKAVLGRAHVEAYSELGIDLGEEIRDSISSDLADMLDEHDLPDGMEMVRQDTGGELVLAAGVDKQVIKDWTNETTLHKSVKKAVNDIMKKAKGRKPKPAEVEKGRERMCEKFYDIRTFGGVLSLASAPNCGQVRGPVQLTFARSVDPIIPLEHSITRMAVATEAEAARMGGDNRTMGRKHTVSYGLYRCHGFISGALAGHPANGTGFSEDDLALFWEALRNMFDHDRSAARGEMAARKLVVFEHESRLGNAPAHALFDRVTVTPVDKTIPARAFKDYQVGVDKEDIPSGITLHEMF